MYCHWSQARVRTKVGGLAKCWKAPRRLIDQGREADLQLSPRGQKSGPSLGSVIMDWNSGQGGDDSKVVRQLGVPMNVAYHP